MVAAPQCQPYNGLICNDVFLKGRDANGNPVYENVYVPAGYTMQAVEKVLGAAAVVRRYAHACGCRHMRSMHTRMRYLLMGAHLCC